MRKTARTVVWEGAEKFYFSLSTRFQKEEIETKIFKENLKGNKGKQKNIGKKEKKRNFEQRI